MSYTIYYSDPAKYNYPITVPDNTVYNGVGTGGLTLVGRNYPAYGQVVASDLIRILENAASSVPPVNPIEGQLWYDNATKKLRFNNGAANNTNWKPINGLYQQEIEPTDAVIGDVWVDTSTMLVKIHDGTGFMLFGNQVDGISDTGAIPAILNDLDGNPHNVLMIKAAGVITTIISGEADFSNNSQIITGSGFSIIRQGINLNSTLNAVFNGTADVATYIASSTGNIPGNDLLKNNGSQSLNGQLTITQDSNALRIGSSPVFTLGVADNGATATFRNNFANYGSFKFYSKDGNFLDALVLELNGGAPGLGQSVRVPATTQAVSTTTGALQVAGGAGIAGDVWLGGSLTFTKIASTLTVGTLKLSSVTTASSTQTGSLVVAGGAGIGGNVYIGGDLALAPTSKLYDAFVSPGTDGQVLVSKGTYVKWQSFNPTAASSGTFTGAVNIGSSAESVSTLTGALIVNGGAGIGSNLYIGGNVVVASLKNLTLNNTVISTGGVRTGGIFTVTNITASTSTSTGALQVQGGAGIAGDLYVGGSITANKLTIQYTTITSVSTVIDDVTTITNTTNAINTNSAALRVVGGVAVGKDLRVGGAGYFTGTVYTNGVPLVTQQSYVINTATDVRVGGVKYVTGASILVDSTGTIAVNTATLMNTSTWARYVSTPASAVQLGGVFAGVLNSNIDVDGSGVISVPLATDTNFGVITIPDYTLSGLNTVDGTVTLSTATAVYLGGVRIGSNISVTSNGTISVATPYVLPVASSTVLGGVKIGNGVSISSSGTISVNTLTTVFIATTSTLGGVTVNPDFPSIIVDPNAGEISLNINFLSQNLSLTKVWNIVDRRYDFTYGLATATNTVLGGVKIGNGFSVSTDGTINVTTATYTLNTATAIAVGGVKIGTGVSISGDGTISVNTGTPYVLTSATSLALGGVKIGSNISIDGNGVISVAAPYVLTTATTGAVGGVQIGSNVSIDGNGVISVAAPYVLTSATSLALGGVRIGAGLSIDGNGIVSVYTGTPYVLSTATDIVLGGVLIGSGINAAVNGTISLNTATLIATAVTATYATFVSSTATGSLVGGVKVGANMLGATDGTITFNTATLVSTATYAAFISSTATGSVVGGVKVGANMLGATDGTLTFNTSTLVSTATTARFISTTATSAQLGGIKLGTYLTATPDGTVSVNASSFTYTLPPATASVLGGVKIGANINVAGDGTISVTPGAYTLTTASNIALGGVKIGSGISITADGTISVPTNTPYTLPVATASVLGGVKPAASGFNVDGSGILTINTSTLYANFASSATYATYVTSIGSTSTIGGVRQVFDFPTVLIDQTYGDLTVNINFTSTNGLAATYAWNAGTSKWDATFNINTSTSNTFWVNNNTNATSTSTGALKVAGGVGIGGNVYAGGNLNLTGVSTFTGATYYVGAVTANSSLGVQGNFNTTGTTTLTGALNAGTGVFSGNLGVTGTTTLVGVVTINNGTAALTTSSASALHVEGGISLGGGIVAGKGFYSTGTFAGTYTDGLVDDYVTGNGRISVGPNDTLTIYAGGVGTTAMLTVSTGTTTVTNALTVSGLITSNSSLDTYSSPSISANAVTLNFATGNIFALASNAAAITANYTNVPTTTGQVIATSLVITQGSTAYIPSAVTINTVSQTIKWQGGSPPTGNANKTDIVSFTFICNGTTTPTVIGSLTTYG